MSDVCESLIALTLNSYLYGWKRWQVFLLIQLSTLGQGVDILPSPSMVCGDVKNYAFVVTLFF